MSAKIISIIIQKIIKIPILTITISAMFKLKIMPRIKGSIIRKKMSDSLNIRFKIVLFIFMLLLVILAKQRQKL